MQTTIPESHQNLLFAAIYGVLTTMMADGQPQMSMVWVDYDGRNFLINTTLERQKAQNMLANPKVKCAGNRSSKRHALPRGARRSN